MHWPSWHMNPERHAGTQVFAQAGVKSAKMVEQKTKDLKIFIVVYLYLGEILQRCYGALEQTAIAFTILG